MQGGGAARRVLRLTLMAALLLLGGSCDMTEITTVRVANLQVSPPTGFVRIDESTRFTASLLGSGGETLSGRAIEWQSLHTSIAVVDDDGNVRGVAPGVATIRATSEGVSGDALVTVTSGPAIAVAPDDITFSGVRNGATPGDRTVSIANAGDGSLTGLSIAVTYAEGEPNGWLGATLAGATAPTSLVLSATQSGLSAGTYTATVQVAASSASNSPVAVQVRLTVLEPQPAIALGATTIGFAASQSGADPTPQNVGITNAGGGTLSGLTATVTHTSGQPTGWLTGVLPAATAPTTLTLRAATGSLTPGTYTAAVRIASSVAQNSPQTIAVTFVVAEPQPALVVNPGTLTFSAVAGGASPVTQTVQTTNGGAGTLNGLSASVTYPSGQPAGWLTTNLGSTTAPSTLTVGAATGSLAAGTYTATVRIASPVAINSPALVEVTFQVGAAAPAIRVEPTTASFTTTATGANPQPVAIAVTNAGGGTLSGLSSTITYNTGEPTGWLLAPLDGTTAPTVLRASASRGTLGVGTYTARVRVASSISGVAPVDVVITFTVASAPPAAPTALTRTVVSDRRIDLSWTDNSQNESGFEVQRSTGSGFTPLDTTSANQTTFVDSVSVVASTSYTYRVRACNAVGCSAFVTAAAITSAPAAPTGLAAAAVSATRVDLSWSDNSADETSFSLERSSNGGQTWTVIQTTASGAGSFSDTGVTGGSAYRYRVRACRSTVCSRYSNEAEVITTATPGVPTGLTASAIAADRIDIAWNAPTGSVVSYRIERKTGALGTFAVIDSVPGTVLTYENTGLSAATQYVYRVLACNAGGCSAPSGEASATTLVLTTAAPQNLTATSVSPTRIDLAWTHTGLLVDRFEIQRAPDSAQTMFSLIHTTADGATRTYSDSPLASATRYWYRVRACNLLSCSDWSNTASGTTQPEPTAPGTPVNVNATATSATQVAVTWQPPAVGVPTQYVVRRRTTGSGGTWTFSTTVAGTATVFNDSGLSPSTGYQYQVRACAGTACSDFSSVATATTPASAPLP